MNGSMQIIPEIVLHICIWKREFFFPNVWKKDQLVMNCDFVYEIPQVSKKIMLLD